MKTPQLPYPELAASLGLDAELYLKREDMHNYGSHKGRSIPLMMKEYLKQGHKKFVISSSGNAAIAAATFTFEHNRNNPQNIISLTIFVGENINEEKLKILKTINNSIYISIKITENPKQQAFQMDKSGEAKLLRQSTDDLALRGYEELATELNKIPNLSAIFIPTSSGTTAEALGETFKKLSQKPEIHIVQNDHCHPLAEIFDKNFTENKTAERSLADAIVDRTALRKEKVAGVIKSSNGFGWIVNDEEIESAIKLTTAHAEVSISPNSALSIAGLKKSIQSGKKFTGAVVCLITGR